MFIEGLRTDSLYVGPFRISQVVGAICFLAGTALIVYMLIRCKKQEKAGEYVPVFAALTEQNGENTADENLTDHANNENNEENQDDGQAD
jgi:phosphatidylglycerol:prolipoprotein diacylglycerol transferase